MNEAPKMNKSETKKDLQERFMQAKQEQTQRFEQFKTADDDVLAQKIMENIHNTPLGKLLGIIATLPEIRAEKVEHGKQLLRRKESDLDEQLDEAMDRVMEELLHE
jgi:hypothetical protein